MTRAFNIIMMFAIVFVCAPIAFGQGAASSILNSKHNLSASGPGTVRASSEQEVCVFCHTPHNSSPIQPMWNRNMPVNAYTVYHSTSLDALPGQPTGSSKLCLSCHDGTIAVGSVLSRDTEIAMSGTSNTLPLGKSNLGTDLSDDHPISFRYDSTLAGRDPKLKNPASLPPEVKLDGRGEMQCTTCHEPHNNSNGKFLVMQNTQSELCASCHNVGMTTIQSHRNCDSCHTMHAAPSGPLLLTGQTIQSTCLTCHSGGAGPTNGPNIAADLNKLSRHDTDPPVSTGMHAPNEITCNDCHEPHTMQTGSLPGAPLISPLLGRIDGVNSVGATVPVAQFQYEVCFKCHSNSSQVQSTVPRQIEQTDTRLEFAPSAISFHPVATGGKNTFVPSLRPGLSTASMIYCTDCHNTDTTALANNTGGPHGSNNRPLLALRYDTMDGASESESAYELCYKCHDRTSILGDTSFSSHRKHIVDERTPCSVCHDAHGISSAQGTLRNNSKLINFDTRVVQPDAITGTLQYVSYGPASGTCYLNCHGANHSNLAYPNGKLSPVPQPTPQPDPIPLRTKQKTVPTRQLPPPPSIRDRAKRP